MKWRCLLGLLLLAGMLMAAPGAAADGDTDLPVGHFYPQTGGSAGPQYGYRVTDEGGIPMWSEFQRLGGVPALGYPISRRFVLDGYVVQATQKVLMQWRPDANPPAVEFVNVFDKLHDLGDDGALQTTYQVPAPLDAALFDAGKSPAQAQADRLQLLNADQAIAARFNPSDSAALARFGLPTSTLTNEGPFLAIRTQRAVLQLWIADNAAAGTHRGDVTIVNGGDIAKALGLVPADAALPETINGLVAPAPAAPPAPAASSASSPAPAPSQQYAWVWKSVSTPPTDCGASQLLIGYLAPHHFSCDDSDPNGGVQFITGHTLDASGHAVPGIIVQANAYGNNYDGTSDQDGTFGIIISNSCPLENRVYNLTVIDGQGRQSSNVYTVNYSNCTIAGEFHVDFIQTGH